LLPVPQVVEGFGVEEAEKPLVYKMRRLDWRGVVEQSNTGRHSLRYPSDITGDVISFVA
jgi:hypothetical protein